MKLPNAEEAWVHPDKILKYLLSETHETGGPKAAFFKRFGFSKEQWTVLDAALRRHARETDVVRTIESPNGVKYVLEGPLYTPDGRTPYIRSIWMIKWNMTVARLVSAYPLGK